MLVISDCYMQAKSTKAILRTNENRETSNIKCTHQTKLLILFCLGQIILYKE